MMSNGNAKSLPFAIGLNILLPGAGYMYMGRIILGFFAMFLIVAMFFSVGMMFSMSVWMVVNIIMAIDMIILFNKNKDVFVEMDKQKQTVLYSERVEDFISLYVCNEEESKKNPVLVRLFQQLSNNKDSSTLDELDKAILLINNNLMMRSKDVENKVTPHPDLSERMRVLIKLHQDELISSDEFEKKKAEIINQI